MLWENDRLRSLVGEVVGRSVLDVVAPESRRKAEEQYALKRLAGKAPHYEIQSPTEAAAALPVEINSVAR